MATWKLGTLRPCAVLLTATSFALHAAPIVLPGPLSGTEAGSSDSSPLGVDAQQRFQQVYGASMLTGLISPGSILTGLTFRLDRAATALPAQTVNNYEIRLSTSRNAPGSLSTTFASNRGSDEVIVRSGPLIITTGAFPSGGSPNGFGFMIQFTVPYVYRGGDLLVEIAQDGFPAGGRYVDADYVTSYLAQTAFGTTYNATTANNGLYKEAIVMEFDVTHAPEPGTLTLFALGLAGVGFGLRWKRPPSPPAARGPLKPISVRTQSAR
jgi:hypothetical protein